jgi:hypothetical protein
MLRVTYKDLVLRFGDNAAYTTMRTVEQLARLSNKNEIVVSLDREKRFQRALEALNTINFAS